MKYFRYTLTIAMVTLFLPAQSFAKKTVCTMTLNSSDEVQLYKKYLPADKFDFVELVPPNEVGASKHTEDWFFKDCDNKQIQCDSLIISGHFMGTFFGDESVYTLSLLSLEEASCNHRCDGILKRPKEVIMYGCNTLAGKYIDKRTPQQYLDVLLKDKIPRDYAERMVAFRYSEIGASNERRMRRAFSEVADIIGFDTLSPHGKEIAPVLEEHLKKVGPHYDELINSEDHTRNDPLINLVNSRLKRKMESTSGLKPESDELLPYCYFENDKVSRTTKLQLIDSILQSSHELEYIPYVVDYLESIKNSPLTSSEARIKQKFSQYENAKEQIAAVVSNAVDGMLSVQIKLIQLMNRLGFETEDSASELISNLLFKDLDKGITIARRDGVCGLIEKDVYNLEILQQKSQKPSTAWEVPKLNLNMEQFPQAAWQSPNFVAMLGCLKPTDQEIINKFYELALSGSPQLKVAAAGALENSHDLPTNVIENLAPLISSNILPIEARLSITHIVAAQQYTNPNLQLTFFNQFLKEQNMGIEEAIEQALERLGVTDSNQEQQLKNSVTPSPSTATRKFSIRLLRSLPTGNRYLEIYLKAITDASSSVRAEALKALGTFRTELTDEMKLAIIERLRTSYDFDTAIACFVTIGQIDLPTQNQQMALANVIVNAVVSTNRDRVSEYAAKNLAHKNLLPTVKERLRQILAVETRPSVRSTIELVLSLNKI